MANFLVLLLMSTISLAQEWKLEPSLALTGDTRDFAYGYANKSIYLFGGTSNQGTVQELRLSDPKPTWTTLNVTVPTNGGSVFGEGAPAPFFPERHSFLIGCEGAYDSSPSGAIYRFDIRTKKFFIETHLPQVLYACRMIEWGGQLLVLGGYQSSATVNTVQIYNLDSKTWANGTSLAVNIEFFGLTRFPPTQNHPGSLFLFGGWTGAQVFTKSIEGYMDNEWRQLTLPLDVAVSSCPAVTLPKNIAYIVGGYSPGGVGSTATQIFHWNGKNKEVLSKGPSLNVARYAGGAVYSTFDKKIYALGGSTSTVETLSVDDTHLYVEERS